MRSSDLHRLALESLQASTTSVLDCANKMKKTVHRYAQWLQNCRKLLRRLHETAAACPGDDWLLHPQILGATNDTFRFLENACKGFDSLLENVWIKNTESLDEKLSKKIDETALRLKRLTQALGVAYERFVSQIRRPGEYIATNGAIDAGFANHCTYIRYFHEIGDLESQTVQFVADLSKKIMEANNTLDQSMSKLNQHFIKKFGKNLTGEAPEKFIVETESLDTAKTVAVASFAVFYQPQFINSVLYQFDDPPIGMKLIVKTANDGMNDSELSVAIDEPVDLIDGSGAEYWLVKKANGREGFVPATCLKPIPSGPGNVAIPPGTVRH